MCAGWPWAVAVIAVAVGVSGLFGLPAASSGAPPRPVSAHARVVALPCSGAGDLFFSLPSDARVVSQSDSQVCATGRVTVTFAGDRATGCAARGLCAYHGTETWNAQGAGDLFVQTLARDGHRSTTAELALGGSGASDHSSVARGPTTAGTCRDHAAPTNGFSSLRVRRSRIEIALGAPGLATIGTRCAGPLTTDIEAALPRRAVNLTQLDHGVLHVDLHRSARFSAGGFSGTVISTVTLAIAQPQTEPLPRPARNRFATARYRVADLTGTANATVRSTGTRAACAALDACGLHGTISFSPNRGDGTLNLEAFGPHDPSKLDLLTALGVKTGGQPAGIGIFGSGSLGTPFRSRSAITHDMSRCTGLTPDERIGLVLQKHGDRLQVSASPSTPAASDPLRSRCPGPRLDLHTFASASLPASILKRSQFEVKLHGGSFHDGPYEVTTRSSLAFTLRRRRFTTSPAR